jgi:hypothetical protein
MKAGFIKQNKVEEKGDIKKLEEGKKGGEC